MCLVAPGLVTEVGSGTALIDIDGTSRTALTLLTPDVRPGDWVLVGAGAVIRCIDPTQAQVMREALAVTSPPAVSTLGTRTPEPSGDEP